MLTITKSTNLTGQTIVDTEDRGQVQVAYFNATVSTEPHGQSNIALHITDRPLYEQYKEQVRADMAVFKDAVFTAEDGI